MPKKRGFDYFNAFYSDVYQTRWSDLLYSLKNKKYYAAKLNSFTDYNEINKKFSHQFLRFQY